MVRLFVAIDLPADIRERLKGPQEHLKKSSARLTSVDPALIHITLKFIGEVPQDAVGRIMTALSGIPFSPFDLRVTGIGSNNPRQPRVIATNLYLAILSRFPSPDELKVLENYIRSARLKSEPRREHLVDIAWALINSPEFIYRH